MLYLYTCTNGTRVPWYCCNTIGTRAPPCYVPWYPWNPQTRTTTETVLREAMQALVRVQAHMPARIVVEIRAADVAVELEPQL